MSRQPSPTHNRWYTEQYNTRRGLADEWVDDLLQQQWPAWSEAARDSAPCLLDLSYGVHEREVIDLFPASGSRKWVVFIHGGYWRAMHGSASSFIAPPLTAAGYNVALPSYRLCPDVTIGTIIDECAQAIAWLARHAGEYSDGCDAIIITGHSAGGHLAAAMFTVDWAQHGVAPSLFRGGIALSGLFDLDPIRQCEMNDILGLTADDVLAWSPARLMPRVDAPLVLAAGARESSEFHRQMAVLAGASGWADIVADVVALDGRDHFNLLEDFLALDERLWAGVGTEPG